MNTPATKIEVRQWRFEPGTLAMTLAEYIGTPQARHLMPRMRTKDNRMCVRRFDAWLGRAAKLDDVTEANLAALLESLCAKVKRSTARQIVFRLGTIARAMHGISSRRQGATPRVRKPKRERISGPRMGNKPPARLTPEQIKGLARPDALLSDAFWQVFYPRALALRAEKTAKAYRITIDQLGEYLGRPAMLGDLDDETVIGWMGSLRDKLAPQTINARRDKLLALWRFLARKRFVEEFPDVPKLDEPAPQPMAWTMEQLAGLLDACLAYEGQPFAGVQAAGWWHSFHLVAYDTGERLGALLQLRWDWLDGADLLVPAHARKGRQKPMLYRLDVGTLAALDAIRLPERELIFPMDRDKAIFYKRYERILKAAGLPCGRRDKTHRIRRTFASHLEAVSPGAATAALAHSSRKVTEAYLDERITQRQRPSDLLPRPWANKEATA
ncbi:MAG: tyrosine-type recombinase/integrase [Planctomycetia bacterium]|nr:tyrosine-type recombinase/integrase [Planctomycetia bacterium]